MGRLSGQNYIIFLGPSLKLLPHILPDVLMHCMARDPFLQAVGDSQVCNRNPVPTTQSGLSPSKVALTLL